MDNEQAHDISITVKGDYTHGPKEAMSVAIVGDGSLEHFIVAFQAALVAAGFHASTAARLKVLKEEK